MQTCTAQGYRTNNLGCLDHNLEIARYIVNIGGGGGCHAPVRPYAPVSKPDLLDEGRVPRGVQGRAGA